MLNKLNQHQLNNFSLSCFQTWISLSLLRIQFWKPKSSKLCLASSYEHIDAPKLIKIVETSSRYLCFILFQSDVVERN